MRGSPTARARDFHDIVQMLDETGLDVRRVEFAELLRVIFATKRVPLGLLRFVGREREFHRTDWESVVNNSSETLQEFDYYYDRVLDVIGTLEAAGIVDAP